MKRSLLVPTLVLALTLIVGAIPALADPGDVDTTFGMNGLATHDEAGVGGYVTTVRRNGGGLAVAAGDGGDALVVGFTAAGDPDPGFGNGGRTRVPLPTSDATVADATVDAEGRILLTGWLSGGNERFWAARLKANGKRDTSFSGDAVAYATFPDSDSSTAYGVATRNNAVIISGEVYQSVGADSVVGVAKFTPSGKRDSGFGNQGRKIFDPGEGAGYNAGWRIIPGPDGTWIISGWCEPGGGPDDTLVIKIKSNGALDGSFENGGMVCESYKGANSDYSYGLARDGSKIVVGIRGSKPMIVRLNKNGSPDGSFGAAGEYEFDSQFSLSGVAVDSQHRVLATSTNTQLPAYRVTEDGSTDNTFGTAGMADNPLSSANGSSVMIQGAKILVSGSLGATDLQVTRYLG